MDQTQSSEGVEELLPAIISGMFEEPCGVRRALTYLQERRNFFLNTLSEAIERLEACGPAHTALDEYTREALANSLQAGLAAHLYLDAAILGMEQADEEARKRCVGM